MVASKVMRITVDRRLAGAQVTYGFQLNGKTWTRTSIEIKGKEKWWKHYAPKGSYGARYLPDNPGQSMLEGEMEAALAGTLLDWVPVGIFVFGALLLIGGLLVGGDNKTFYRDGVERVVPVSEIYPENITVSLGEGIEDTIPKTGRFYRLNAQPWQIDQLCRI